MPLYPIIAAVAAVLALIASLLNSYMVWAIIKPLIMLFGIAIAALLLFALFALVKKFWGANEKAP